MTTTNFENQENYVENIETPCTENRLASIKEQEDLRTQFFKYRSAYSKKLNPAQERIAGKRINAGNKAEEFLISKHSELTSTDIQNLLNIISLKNESVEKLVNCNGGLVVYFAKQWLRPYVSLDDLVSAGMEGLTVAAGKYDYRKGAKFATFVSPWIKSYISRAFESLVRNVSLPEGVTQQIRKNYRAETELTDRLGRKATLAEIQKFMKENSKFSFDVMQYDKCEKHFDALFDKEDNESGSLHDVVADDSLGCEDILMKNCQSNTLSHAVKALSGDQKSLICKLFGLCGYEKQSQSSIAKELGISSEAIRQRKEKIFEILRSNSDLALAYEG